MSYFPNIQSWIVILLSIKYIYMQYYYYYYVIVIIKVSTVSMQCLMFM